MKNYILSALYFIGYLPRLFLAGVLIIIPTCLLPAIIFYILSAKIFSLGSLLNFIYDFSYFIDGMSFFDSAGFIGISLGVLLFTCGDNSYGRLVKKISPISNFRDYE